MRTIAIAVTLAAVTTGAFAQGRPSTTAMSCRAAASLVQARGAIVLATGPNTYDRYVRDQSFCQHGQVTKPAFTPAGDTPYCMIGYYCFDQSYDPR